MTSDRPFGQRARRAAHTSATFASVGVRLAVAAVGLTLGGSLAVEAVPAAAATCSSSVRGDVNGDGHAELAVGEPGNHNGAGAVHVLYGTGAGLVADASGTARNDQYVDQDTTGVPGSSEKGDGFATAVVFGDFNGDGCSDLVISAPGENRLAGSITVLYGSRSGLGTLGAQRISAPTSGEQVQLFGTHLAVGDLNGDGLDDLAATGRNRQSARGAVVVMYGDATGLDRGADRPVVIRGDSAGVGVEPIGFASGVAVGDFDGNGRNELAVGQSAADDEGQVAVLQPRAGRFVRSASVTLRSPGVPATGQRYEGFGEQLAVGDADADGRDELAVGVYRPLCGSDCEDSFPAPPETGDGAVAVFHGAAAGLSGRDAQLWTQDSPGVVGTSNRDGFGAAVAFGRLDAGGTDDLLVGAPFDDVSGHADAGSVTVLLGSARGLTTAGTGGSSVSQNTAGVAGNAEKGDRFGSSLTTVDLGAAQAAAVIGVPDESVGTKAAVGQVHQLALGAGGPRTTGSRAFNPDTIGVQGLAESGDAFGRSLS